PSSKNARHSGPENRRRGRAQEIRRWTVVVGRRTSWHRRTRQRWPAAPTVPGASTPTGQAWARELLTRDDWVVLDTETTGLDAGAEVIDLAVLDRNGTVLLETLLRPLRP